jgi:hypothetical protein
MRLTATEQVQCAGDYRFCFAIIEVLMLDFLKIFHNSLHGRRHGCLPDQT